jgi:hypothetical protein
MLAPLTEAGKLVVCAFMFAGRDWHIVNSHA